MGADFVGFAEESIVGEDIVIASVDGADKSEVMWVGGKQVLDGWVLPRDWSELNEARFML